MVSSMAGVGRGGLGRGRPFSMVSSRSSVPSSAKYDDWIGISRCVDATRALTVSSPSVGGQSMMIFGNRSTIGATRSLSRKCESISPTSLASSLARAIRDGATQRFGWFVEGRITSSKVTSFSAMASYTLRVTLVTSTYDMVLLACGSRSTRRVGLPRNDSAAARLIAVVVLPTPPFWFAIATIMAGRRRDDSTGASRLHLVLAHIVGVERLQPLLEPLRVPPFRSPVHGL